MTPTHTHTETTMTPTHTHTEILFNLLHNRLTQRHNVTDIDNTVSIDRYLKRQLNTILSDLTDIYIKGIQHKHFTYEDVFAVKKKDYMTKWAQYRINGKNMWAYLDIFAVITTQFAEGHTGAASAIQFKNPILIDAIREHIRNTMPVKCAVAGQTIHTEIDLQSLRTFIACSKDDKHIHQAKQILVQGQSGVLEQEITSTSTGRVYLGGINLQQCKKEVRHAALPDNYAYDVNCAIFAVFAGLATEFTGVFYPVVLDYIVNRKSLRQEIADDCGITVDQVKQALTSLSNGSRFGPRGTIKKYTGEGYDKFATHPKIVALVEEYRRCIKIVKDQLKTDIKFKDFVGDANIFFKFETLIMEQFIHATGKTPNLVVHDCVYFKNSVNYIEALAVMQVPYVDQNYIFIEESI